MSFNQFASDKRRRAEVCDRMRRDLGEIIGDFVKETVVKLVKYSTVADRRKGNSRTKLKEAKANSIVQLSETDPKCSLRSAVSSALC